MDKFITKMPITGQTGAKFMKTGLKHLQNCVKNYQKLVAEFFYFFSAECRFFGIGIQWGLLMWFI